MDTEALTKMAEIQLSKVTGAELLRLDPSLPYIVVLPEKTPTDVIHQLVGFLGRQQVCATILVGDPKNFHIFGSFPWQVKPQDLNGEKPAKKVKEGLTNAAVEGVLLDFVPEGRYVSPALVSRIIESGPHSDIVKREVLSLQNQNLLLSGALTAIKSLEPAPKAKVARKATKKSK